MLQRRNAFVAASKEEPALALASDTQATRPQNQLLPSQIRAEASAQQRVEMNAATVQEYAEAMKEGAVFPPLDIFQESNTYWLADGFHRLSAHRSAFGEDKPVACRVMQGGRREALRHALGANSSHGLRRTADDKRKAVQSALADDEWSQWSDREIAKLCKVSNTFVGKMRGALTGVTVNVDRVSPQNELNSVNVDRVSPQNELNSVNVDRVSPQNEPNSVNVHRVLPEPAVRKFTTSTGKIATIRTDAINRQRQPASVTIEAEPVRDEFAEAIKRAKAEDRPIVEILAEQEAQAAQQPSAQRSQKIMSLCTRMVNVTEYRDEYQKFGGDMALWMAMESAIYDAINGLK